MIHIRSLEFQYPTGDFHLDVPEFTVEQSEKVAVIGPSGSGKTTPPFLIFWQVFALPKKAPSRWAT